MVFSTIFIGALVQAQLQLPETEGKILVQQRCAACHGLEVVVAKKRTEADWDEVIGRMINNGANINSEERKTVAKYLFTHFGTSQEEKKQDCKEPKE